MRRLATLALSLLCLSMPAHAANNGKPIGMVTGPETGTYVQIGRDIASLAKDGGIPIDVKTSLGSIDNLRRMSTRGENAGLGIVQSDVLGFLKRSQSSESQTIASKLRMIAPFYAEEVHLLARRDIASIEDLQGKRVVVGTEGSGNMLTAMNLFGIMGVKPANLYKVAPPEGIVAVLTGQADAVIFVGGKPVKLFKNMEQLAKAGTENAAANAQALAQVHFLPLEDARLKEDYTPAMITSSDYSFVKESVPTVAVRAVLVSYDFTLKNEPYYHARCAELARFGKTLQQKVTALQQSGHPKWKEVNLAADVGLWQRDSCAWPAMQAAAKPVAKQEQKFPIASAKPVAKLAEMKPAAGTPAKPAEKPAPSLVEKAPRVDGTTQRLQQDLLRIINGN